jgi:hypothetical protein
VEEKQPSGKVSYPSFILTCFLEVKEEQPNGKTSHPSFIPSCSCGGERTAA